MSELLLAGARAHDAGGAVDVLVRGGRIAAIAPAGSLDTGGAERVGLDGRFVGPGMWDEHVHGTQLVIRRRRLDLTGAGSAAETIELVRAELARGSAHDMLVGYGFRDATWPDAPSARAIEALGVDLPVVLISGDLHAAWLNARAAQRLRVTLDATGLVREGPWIEAAARLDEGEGLAPAAFREASEAAARRGVVGVVEYENADNVRDWPERVAAGVDLLRVETAVWPDRLEGVVERGLRTGDPLEPRGLVTMGRLKVVVDGSLNTRTALCFARYPGLPADAPHPFGVATTSPVELRELLGRARAGGLEVAVHAIGDRASSEVLDAFAELGMRGVVEHAQLLTERDVARFAELGIAASVQPEHAMDDRDVADRHWAGRTAGAFAYGALHRAGAELRLGSDAPVAPLDPWITLAAATDRSRGDRDRWHPEQELPFGAALAASTRGRLGIAVGDVADLVVTDLDPWTASRDELRAMPVAATLLAGRFTHRGV